MTSSLLPRNVELLDPPPQVSSASPRDSLRAFAAGLMGPPPSRKPAVLQRLSHSRGVQEARRAAVLRLQERENSQRRAASLSENNEANNPATLNLLVGPEQVELATHEGSPTAFDVVDEAETKRRKKRHAAQVSRQLPIELARELEVRLDRAERDRDDLRERTHRLRESVRQDILCTTRPIDHPISNPAPPPLPRLIPAPSNLMRPPQPSGHTIHCHGALPNQQDSRQAWHPPHPNLRQPFPGPFRTQPPLPSRNWTTDQLSEVQVCKPEASGGFEQPQRPLEPPNSSFEALHRPVAPAPDPAPDSVEETIEQIEAAIMLDKRRSDGLEISRTLGN